ncbi:hypothetical protein HDV01_000699 [Terramyces sp. JEL0728]|nr:hypothetical protein HDV01_000699 [Terramyces sp. JEL0728]
MLVNQLILVTIITCILIAIGIGIAILHLLKRKKPGDDDMEIGNPVIDDNPLRSKKVIMAKYSQFTNQEIVKPRPVRAKEGSNLSQDTLFDSTMRYDTQPITQKLQLECTLFPNNIYDTSPSSVTSDGVGYTPSTLISMLNKA